MSDLLEAVELLARMAHPTRLAVLVTLRDGPATVGALADHLEVEQSALSHQLRLLRDSGLVVSEPRGRRRLYRLADRCVADIVHATLVHAAERRAGR